MTDRRGTLFRIAGLAAWAALAILCAGPSCGAGQEHLSMDILAYCHKIYGDSASASDYRDDPYSWRCDIYGKEHPIDLNELCRLQYGPKYTAQIQGNPDPYNWFCTQSAN
jgi:hypothetical protein